MADQPETSAEQALAELAKRIRDLSEAETTVAPSLRPTQTAVQLPYPGSGASGLDLRLSAVETRLGQVETRLAVVETKLGSVEVSMVRVETAVIHMQDNARTDFRVTFGALIATALGLAAMMAKGFHWL